MPLDHAVDLWLIALIVLAADLGAIAAMALIRRRAPADGFFRDSQVAAGAFTVTGTIFAVMVGFVFLIAFQSYAAARTSARTEAGATAALFHAADAFPGPARRTLQGDLICYSRGVVH
ncbi:MAG: bestrophin-like domain, partial [Solirubrobacterales bacterium]